MHLRPLLLGEGWPPDTPGGLNRYFADLLRALESAGIAAHAVVVGPASDAPASLTAVAGRDSSLIRRLRFFARVADGAAEEANLLDAHFAVYAILPAVLQRARRLPLVVHFHGPWADEGRAANEGRWQAAGKRAIERMLYRRATTVITLSSAFRQVVVERYGVSPWRVRVIPPAVDLDRFRPGDRTRARNALGLPTDARVVVCVRRLVPRMGVDDLLTAWADLPAAERTSSVLVIGGDGPARAELMSTASRLGLSAGVRFTGALTEQQLVELYQAGDVAVVPSRALEGFGLVVLEALACGTPVITTDAGGLPEAVADLARDAVVAAGRPAELSQRLAAALQGERPLPTATDCRHHAEKYSRSRLARNHLDVYGAVVRPKRQADIRVVYVDHCARLSGGEVALLRLLEALDGVQAHVILGEDGPLVAECHARGLSVEVLPLQSSARDLNRADVAPTRLPVTTAASTAAYVARLARRLRKLRPDVVHANSLKGCLYGSLAGRMAGIPVVWHARDRIAADYLPDTAARLVRVAAHRLPTAIVANSHVTLATLSAHGRRQCTAVIPDPFRRRRPVTPEPAGPFVVGVVGRLAPWKGQHVVLEAFARAFPTGTQRCVVVGAQLFGEDDYARSLRPLAERLGISDRVEFRGFQHDVEAEIDRMHVVVHASVVPEPFGQVVVEAMAGGRPVIATDQGGPTEIVTPERDGLLYQAGDTAALAAALGRLADDPGLRSRLASEALQRAADYQPETIAAAMLDIYREIRREY